MIKVVTKEAPDRAVLILLIVHKYSTVQNIRVQYSIVQYSTVQYSTVQYPHLAVLLVHDLCCDLPSPGGAGAEAQAGHALRVQEVEAGTLTQQLSLSL